MYRLSTFLSFSFTSSSYRNSFSALDNLVLLMLTVLVKDREKLGLNRLRVERRTSVGGVRCVSGCVDPDLELEVSAVVRDDGDDDDRDGEEEGDIDEEERDESGEEGEEEEDGDVEDKEEAEDCVDDIRCVRCIL